jgi:hypothetical protein
MPGFNDGMSFIYAVNSTFSTDPNRSVGTLNWLEDEGRDLDQVGFKGPNIVGSGWDQPNSTLGVFTGKGGIIYAIRPNGDLSRYVHLGVMDGTPRYVDGMGSAPIGSGFNQFKHVFGGFENVIYAVKQDGTLLWFLDRDGTATQLEGGQVVGSGFNVPSKVFAGDLNAIYTIEGDSLFHRQHLGMQDGTNQWTDKVKISTSTTAAAPGASPQFNTHTWNDFDKVFAPAPMPANANMGQGGYIYMVTPEGELWRFRHFGFRTGDTDTRGPDSLGKAHGLGENYNTLLTMIAARI